MTAPSGMIASTTCHRYSRACERNVVKVDRYSKIGASCETLGSPFAFQDTAEHSVTISLSAVGATCNDTTCKQHDQTTGDERHLQPSTITHLCS